VPGASSSPKPPTPTPARTGIAAEEERQPPLRRPDFRPAPPLVDFYGWHQHHTRVTNMPCPFPCPFLLLLHLVVLADELAPPAPSRAPNRAAILRPEFPDGLAMLHACSRAKHRPESATGAPDWLSPASSPPRSCASATQRRRPRSSSPLVIRSCVDDPD